jgi:hypothetical protein
MTSVTEPRIKGRVLPDWSNRAGSGSLFGDADEASSWFDSPYRSFTWSSGPSEPPSACLDNVLVTVHPLSGRGPYDGLSSCAHELDS